LIDNNLKRTKDLFVSDASVHIEMAGNCKKCNKTIQEQQLLSCNGACKNVFHMECMNVSRSALKFISENENVKWFCSECNAFCDLLSQFHKKIDDLIALQHDHDEKFKSHESVIELLKKNTECLLANQNIHNIDIKNSILNNNVKKTFADVLKRQKDDPVVVVKPKSAGQKSEVTQKFVKENIDPSVIPVKNVRSVSNGSVVIHCQDRSKIDECKKSIESRLGSEYEVVIPEKRQPSVKIVGLSEIMSEEVLITKMKAQNPFIPSDSVIKVTELKKKNDKIFASFSCDALCFKKIIDNERLLVGWDSCRVYEHFKILRCFNCSGYHHTAKECKNKRSCPRCSLDHELSECKSELEKCVNCCSANGLLKLSLCTSHASWSRDCPVYKKKLNMSARKVNYLQ
jgi:hypothetical protein